MAGCYFLAVIHCISAQKTAGIVTAMLEGESLSAKEAQEICAQEEALEETQYACFWGEQPDAPVQCRETGKSSSASLILVQGNPELVMPGTLALIWQQDGCFVDTKTSEELFGTDRAAGQILWCREKSYTVCGTFESPGQAVVRQASQEDELCLDTVSLRTAGGDGTGEAEQFLMRNGLSGEKIEFTFLSTLINDLLLILPVVLSAGVIRFLLKYQRSVQNTAGRAVCFGMVLLAAFAAGWLLLHHLKIPGDMVPTKWSDFSFWADWWKRQRQNLLRILGSAQGETQLMMLWNLLISLLCNLLAVFTGLSAVHGLQENE